MDPEVIGWLSAVVLGVSLALQIARQWKAGPMRAAPFWPIACQLAAAAGFVVYSLLLESWVFAAASGATLCGTAVYWGLVRRGSRCDRRPPARRSDEQMAVVLAFPKRPR